jgi:alpha-beta hydrolase superfamily lysophospholipase
VRRIGWRRLALGVVLLGALAGNGLAWMQARAMTHYAAAGQRTAQPEALTLPEKVGAVLTGVTIPRPENRHTPADVGLAYEVRQIPLGVGEQLEAWWVPQAAPHGTAILFPAYASSKESLLHPTAALYARGWAALLVDFRGVGGSSGQDTTLGVREAADVARAVAYARQIGAPGPLVLYGISMGSAAVLRAVAAAGVTADAIILESPFDRLLATTENRFHAMGLPAFPAAGLLIFWGSVQQGFNGFSHNPVDYAGAVRCPALVLYGARDPRVTPAQARAVFDRLGGPKQFVTVPDAGHELLIDVNPDLWQQEVGQFLDQIGDSP